MSDRSPDEIVRGVLHVDVAFDWGDEIDLARAGTLAPVGNPRTRSPAANAVSIGYRPPPLRFPLSPVTATLPGCEPVTAEVEAPVFDFGGVNVRIDVPFEYGWDDLPRLAGDQAALLGVARSARTAAEPLFTKITPAIQSPACPRSFRSSARTTVRYGRWATSRSKPKCCSNGRVTP